MKHARKILGAILVGTPFAAIFGIFGYAVGIWPLILVVSIMGAIVAMITGGVHLLMADD